jgi:hypothetical protein
MSTIDDGRWLISNKLPGAVFAHPDCEAILDVHDRAGYRNLGRHSPGHERGAIDNQNAVCRVRDLKVGKVAGADLAQVARLVVVVGLRVGVDEVIRAQFIERGGVACEQGPVTPILKGFDFVAVSDRMVARHSRCRI